MHVFHGLLMELRAVTVPERLELIDDTLAFFVALWVAVWMGCHGNYGLSWKHYPWTGISCEFTRTTDTFKTPFILKKQQHTHVFSSPGARWGIVGGLTPASVVVRRRRQQLFQRSSTKLLGQFQPNFTEMFIGWSPSRFLQIMNPGPKMARPGGLSVFHRKLFKNHLLRNYWANFNQISQKCFLGAPLSDPFKLWPPGPK